MMSTPPYTKTNLIGRMYFGGAIFFSLLGAGLIGWYVLNKFFSDCPIDNPSKSFERVIESQGQTK